MSVATDHAPAPSTRAVSPRDLWRLTARLFRRGAARPRHAHAFTYTPSLSGWTTARCECGYFDIC